MTTDNELLYCRSSPYSIPLIRALETTYTVHGKLLHKAETWHLSWLVLAAEACKRSQTIFGAGAYSDCQR